MKKLLSIILTLVFLLSTVPTGALTVDATTEYISGDYTYTVTNDEACITDYTGLETNVAIPSKLGNYVVTSIGSYAFGNCKNITDISLPNTIRKIDYAAFSQCNKIQTLSIPDSVTTINNQVFEYCSSLTSLKIGVGVTTIDASIFWGCINLIEIIVDTKNKNYSSEDGILFNKEKNILIKYPAGKTLTDYKIPITVSEIGDSAFESCNLINVEIPNSVKSIGMDAFRACELLENIFIPDSVTEIGSSAFELSGLTSLTFPNSITKIRPFVLAECYSLESVTIPSNVTYIADTAFKGCKKLKEIKIDEKNKEYCSVDNVIFSKDKTILLKYAAGKTETAYDIPLSVSKIGDNAFDRCFNLLNVNIPYSVLSIGVQSFWGCNNLENITIPKNVLSIGAYSFVNCENITSVNIEDGVMSIDNNAFVGCEQLENIFIPSSVTEIGNYAFYNCKNISNVFYADSEENWNKITIGNNNGSLTEANFTFNYDGSIIINNSFKCGNKNYKKSSGNGYFYKDTYFDTLATEYNQQLATMSLCLALSTYQNNNVNYENAKKLMSQCEYKKIKTYGWDEKATKDSIACIIGSKVIDDTTIIVIAVRSGGYGAEWASNVTVGTSGDHKGFDEASDTVLNNIKNYISTKSITGKVKFWITGYSRGAATATHTAAKLNNTIISNVQFNKYAVYAYGFATPAGASIENKPHSSEYNNIHSVLHYHDIVPLVAPGYWGFTTYGTIRVLPTAELSSSYIELENKMKKTIDEMTDDDGVYALDDFYPIFLKKQGVGTFSRKFIHSLAVNIGGRYNYVNSYQSELRNILNGAMGDSTSGMVCGVFDEVYSKDLIKLLGKEMKNSFATATTAIANISLLAEAHARSGAYYLAWMQSMDTNYFSNAKEIFYKGDLRTTIVNCPVDVYVYNTSNNLVAAIIDEKPQEIDNSSIVSYIDENGQKIVHLPIDGEYEVKIVARKDCETTYTINEYSSFNAETSRIVTYSQIPMQKGEQLNSKIEQYSEEEIKNGTQQSSSAEYTVKTESNSTLIANLDISGEEIKTYTYNVSVECNEQNGIVEGGGIFTAGEFCQVTARNKPGYEFTSWTVNGNEVSSDYTYRFAVGENTNITANYKKCSHKFDNICDEKCDVCGDTRKVPDHTYDNEIDPDCNWCGSPREITGKALVKGEDGVWYYYVDGEKSNDRTLVKKGDVWFFVENGVWNKTARTLVKMDNVWFFVENGRWNKTAETVVKYNNVWFYVKNGRWDTTGNTLVKYGSNWLYIKNGRWDNTARTLIKYNGYWFFVEKGVWNKTAETVVKYNNVWFYVKNGKWDTTGHTLVKYNGNWLYIKNGRWSNTANTYFTYKNVKFKIVKGVAQV